MNNNTYNNTYEARGFDRYLASTFLTVTFGLLISAVSALLISMFAKALGNMFYFLMIGSCVLEIGVAIFFGAALHKMSESTAYICYFLYAVLTGVSFSSILLAYAASTVVLAFVVTAVVFGSMAVIGHTTSVDLSRFSTLFRVGLISIIAVSILNIFLKSSMVEVLVTYASVIIFLGLVAYDMQKLRYYYSESAYEGNKMMVVGAFELYLDFINLFLRVLSILSKRENRR